MRLWDRIKNVIKVREVAGLEDEKLLKWLGLSGASRKLMSEVTYFTCLKMLAETMGKLPVKFYRKTHNGVERAEPNDAYKLLSVRPNPLMTPTTFWSTVENNRNHFGNAYVWIRREFTRKKFGGEITIRDLWVMPSADVSVVMDDKGVFGGAGDIYYWYTDRNTGEQYIYPSADVMHFKTSATFDGYIGKPVREILRSTIEGGLESQNFMNNLYKNGLTARAALQYTGDLDKKLEKKMIARFEEYAVGAQNAGKFIPVPIGMKIEPLNIKLTESQFFELKKYTSLQIAGAFGIKPNQINDYEKSSYSNSEMQNLSFYVDTSLYILKNYEEEMNYKLLGPEEREADKYFKFNVNVLLRTDAKTQEGILTGYVKNGIYKPNEARAYMDLQMAEGGDDLVCNGNFIRLADIGKKKGGE